jgi:hypothetical protein
MTATLRDFASQQRQGARGLVQEIFRRLHDEALRMSGPLLRDPHVDRCRFVH